MLIRAAASEREIEQAIQNFWLNDPPLDSTDAAGALEHWLGLFADWPDGFFMALDDVSQQIVGVASAAIHPPQWILTNFFVHPDYHGQGIGRALFSRALAWREGCTRFAVHASQHPSAQRLYMGAGMFPQPYSIVFKGRSTFPPPAERQLIAKSCPPLKALSTLNALDVNAFGFTREMDHAWWANHGSYFLANWGNEPIGYFRVSLDGIIGPLVVVEAGWMADTLALAIRVLMDLSTVEHTIFVPGVNTAAIAYLLLHGYRYDSLELLLSSEPMPNLANVIFHDTDRL
jgi:GNAT superfamily N-acetyltransferase